MDLSDFIGSRGEAIALARLARVYRRDVDLPYFYPQRLGEKSQSLDFFVEAVGAGDCIPFFFVQVKTTRLPLITTQIPPRLRVRVDPQDLTRIRSYPAPSYILGVHEPSERVFLAATEALATVSSLTTAHELDEATLRQLHDEVRRYWADRPGGHVSQFHN